MSIGQIAQTYGTAAINNIGPTLLFYFGIRFLLGRFAKRETLIRLGLGLLSVMFAVSTSSVVGNQLINNYKISLLQNIVPVLLFFFAACIGVRQGAIRNPFEGWVRVPTSVEEGSKPYLEQQSRRAAS